MATPNEPNPPKKPIVPPSKPGITPTPKPTAGGKPVPPPPPAKAGTPPPKAGTPPPSSKGITPTKPLAPGQKPPPSKAVTGKPAASAPKKVSRNNKGDRGEGGKRRFGQVLIDLGFCDDDQLWELLDEAKNSGTQIGQAAVARGLITEEQLFQALAEQHSLKLVNLQEVKPQPDALTLVPETMAGVYK